MKFRQFPILDYKPVEHSDYNLQDSFIGSISRVMGAKQSSSVSLKQRRGSHKRNDTNPNEIRVHHQSLPNLLQSEDPNGSSRHTASSLSKQNEQRQHQRNNLSVQQERRVGSSPNPTARRPPVKFEGIIIDYYL